MCRDCHDTFRRASSGVDGIDETPSVMWPFFGCVSFDPVLKGRCGNCAWEEHVCTWEIELPETSLASDPHPLAGLHTPVSASDPLEREVSLTSWRVEGEIPEDREVVLAGQMARAREIRARNKEERKRRT